MPMLVYFGFSELAYFCSNQTSRITALPSCYCSLKSCPYPPSPPIKRYFFSTWRITTVTFFVFLNTFLDLDPCLDVTCDYHCLCKAFAHHDARCVSVDSCPSFQEPICSSNGTTYDNNCLFEQQMCLLQLNFTVQHPGSCEGMFIYK